MNQSWVKCSHLRYGTLCQNTPHASQILVQLITIEADDIGVSDFLCCSKPHRLATAINSHTHYTLYISYFVELQLITVIPICPQLPRCSLNINLLVHEVSFLSKYFLLAPSFHTILRHGPAPHIPSLLPVLAQCIQFQPPQISKVVAAVLDEYVFDSTGGVQIRDALEDHGSLLEGREAIPYWYEDIKHQGISSFGPSGHQVYRNVTDFGAKGMGSERTICGHADVN